MDFTPKWLSFSSNTLKYCTIPSSYIAPWPILRNTQNTPHPTHPSHTQTKKKSKRKKMLKTKELGPNPAFHMDQKQCWFILHLMIVLQGWINSGLYSCIVSFSNHCLSNSVEKFTEWTQALRKRQTQSSEYPATLATAVFNNLIANAVVDLLRWNYSLMNVDYKKWAFHMSLCVLLSPCFTGCRNMGQISSAFLGLQIPLFQRLWCVTFMQEVLWHWRVTQWVMAVVRWVCHFQLVRRTPWCHISTYWIESFFTLQSYCCEGEYFSPHANLFLHPPTSFKYPNLTKYLWC